MILDSVGTTRLEFEDTKDIMDTVKELAALGEKVFVAKHTNLKVVKDLNKLADHIIKVTR